jgi:hypothetical protein
MDWVVKIPWGELEFWGIATMWSCLLITTIYREYRDWQRRKITVAVDAKAKIRLFEDGDLVMLKEENPFKGTLTCGKVYRVHHEHYNYVMLENADNGTKGYFQKEYFEKATYDPHSPGAIEYDEIMEMQELVENGGIPDCQHRGETNLCQKKSEGNTHG